MSESSPIEDSPQILSARDRLSCPTRSPHSQTSILTALVIQLVHPWVTQFRGVIGISRLQKILIARCSCRRHRQPRSDALELARR